MGFEIVVRPVVFPDIRPAPARSLPPEDDPAKGFAVIKSSGGEYIDLPYSYSINASKSRETETQRKVDKARVYQKNPDKSVNRDNFIDIEVAKRIWMKEGDLTINIYKYAPIEEKDNIEILERDIVKLSGD